MAKLGLIFCFISSISLGQTALQNSGNLQMHEGAQVGFHIDLVNNGIFNQNLGLAGFYNTNNPLSISGRQIPRFFDMEVDVIDHLFLDINTEVENSLGFTNGDVITPRFNPNISLDFLPDAVYVLEDDFRNVDGYASYIGSDEFIFPIGDNDKFRPLIIPTLNPTGLEKAAYFDEDPNFPSTFTTPFNTEDRMAILGQISEVEFWDFNGPENSIVTLTWDGESNIDDLADDLENLRVVGWHILDAEWKDLGNTNTTGTLIEGTISSEVFNPSNFEVLTFGSLIGPDELIIYNLFSPNGDGVNDVFVIDGLEIFENELNIYNRWGNIVYQEKNYKNDWDGTSNGDRVLSRDKKLPAGTYYYVLELKNGSNINYTGWIYINY